VHESLNIPKRKFYLLGLHKARSFWKNIANMPGVESPRPPQNVPQSRFGATETGSPRSLKKPDPEYSIMSNGFEGVQSEALSVPSNEEEEEEDGRTEPAEGATEAAEGTVNPEEDDGEEVVPVGSVDAEGNVVDREGHVVGKVEGEIPEGSLVDTVRDSISMYDRY